MKLVACIAVLALGALAVQEVVQVPEAPVSEEHRWLAQLVGEWDCKIEATMAPGAEPMLMESTESVRSVGGLWILAEGKADFGGMPFTSFLTLGYDLQEGAYVGTWIDTMQTHLWVYRGQLDESRKVLTLEAEGPSMEDPARKAKYRDSIEIAGPDHKILRSSMLGPDGEWTTFMKAEYRRKPKK